jgi:hypothetical protein
MATAGPDDFRVRARRAYEWGRLRHALARGSPAVLLTAASSGICHEPGKSVAIGAVLLALAAGLHWYGRAAAQAASAGMNAGLAAFALTVVAFHLYAHPSHAEVLIINGSTGLAVGLWLSVASSRQAAHRDLFLLFSTAVATLCGMLACIVFGQIGLAGMVVGAFASSAPVAIYRRATA